MLYTRQNELPHARLGVVVAKRFAPRAVTRNTIKRVTRELFRHAQLPALDCVVRLARPVNAKDGPATTAALKALAKAGMQPSDIDLYEINEAFAVVPMKTARDLDVSLDRVNVNGGAIAMGHPLGATGCVILGTLLDELERRNLSTGCATLCVGGGMGIATIIERV